MPFTTSPLSSIKLKTLVAQRARKFAIAVIAMVALGLVVAEGYVLTVELRSARESAQATIRQHEAGLTRALLASDGLALITELEATTGVTVRNSDGVIVGQSLQPALGLFTTETVSGLSDGATALGSVTVQTPIAVDSLLQNVLFAFALAVILVAGVARVARSVLRDLSQAILDPLSEMTAALVAADGSVRGDDVVLKSDLSQASQEVKRLVLSHNHLIRKIRDLNEREVENAELVQRALIAKQVSHDIRSPLSALQMVLGVTKNLNVDERALIEAASRRIKHIAQSLLDSTREVAAPEAGTFEFTSAVQKMLIEKNIEHPILQIEALHLPSVPSVRVIGDELKFMTAFSNLLNNSVEASPHPVVEVAIVVESSIARLILCDNGVGISPSLLARLGVPGLTHGKRAGNGLGLSSAMQVIRSFGGELRVISEQGRGTTIEIDLRLADGVGVAISGSAVALPATRRDSSTSSGASQS